MPGNLVAGAPSRARTDAQLAQARVELVHSRAPLLARAAAGGGDRLGLRADRDRASRRPALSAAVSRRSTACSARSRRRRRRAAGARRWSATNCCCLPSWASASTSQLARSAARPDDLVAVSPRSGRAVSAAEAEPYAGQAAAPCPLRRDGGQARPGATSSTGLSLSGHFLARDLLTDRAAPVAESREPADRALAPRRRTRPSLTR